MSVLVVVERDPDGGSEVSVFADGVEVAAQVVTIDPGAGWTRAEWNAARDRACLEAQSEAVFEVVSAAFARHADSEFITRVAGSVGFAADGSLTVGEAVRVITKDRRIISGHVYADRGSDWVGVAIHRSVEGGLFDAGESGVMWCDRDGVLRSGVRCSCRAVGAETVFYSLPAELIAPGCSTADGQDVLTVYQSGSDVWVQVYTPRSDDPAADAANQATPEWRVFAPGVRGVLAVFGDTAVDLSAHVAAAKA